MDEIAVIMHIFMSVLIMGTLWRLATYHLIASSNITVQHIGKGMSVQY